MSKSLGNTFDLFDWIKRYGLDAVRYFLLREMVTGQDSEFALENFENRYNNELANDWGNLISRTFNMVQRYCDGIVPMADEDYGLKAEWDETYAAVCKSFDTFLFSQGLDSLLKFVRTLNRFIELKAPWKLAKNQDEDSRKELTNTLACLIEGIRLVVQVLQIAIPESSQKVMSALHLVEGANDFNWNTKTLAGIQLSEKLLLFPKINLSQES